jgi:glutamine amidotransferase
MSSKSPGTVAIVDYGMGNLYSVQRACDYVGLHSSITSSPAEVLAADGVILPGMGAMPDAMAALDRTGLTSALQTCAERGTPLFGVCLGLQLLMSEGSEFCPHRGLGIIEGGVVRFAGNDDSGFPLKVPHIGWNKVEVSATRTESPWSKSLMQDLPDSVFMYFVHSYYVVPADPAVTLATTRYGEIQFCSVLLSGSIFASQFHPERSGPQGLSMYKNFARQVEAVSLSHSI